MFLSIELLKKEVPDYIDLEINFKSQKIIFKFLQNKKSFIFNLKPLQVIFSKNCVITRNVKYMIKNPLYIKEFNFLKKIEDSVVIKTFLFSVVNFSSYFFIPNFIYDFLQFNDLFTYFDYLNIDGGSFYNFIFSLKKQDDDLDILLIDEEKEYEYQIILSEIENLVIISLLDFYLIFSILFIYISKIILKNTVYYRFIKTAHLLKKLEKIKIRYYSLKLSEKIIYLIKAYYVVFDSNEFIFYFENLIFLQYIFRLPNFSIIFMKKYHLLKPMPFFIYLLSYIFITYLLMYRLIEIIYFLKINSYSLFRKFVIINDKKNNWLLILRKFIYYSFNLLIIFTICILKTNKTVCFCIISVLFIIEIILLMIFTIKNFKFPLILDILTTVVFFIWTILVFINNEFDYKFGLVLNILYFFSNLLKLLAEFFLIVI